MISFLLRELPQLIGREDLRINTILELGAPGSRDAERIHAKIKQDVPDEVKTIGTISFGEKKCFPGLQAADSLAHPSFQQEKTDLEIFPFPTGTLIDAKKTLNNRFVIPPIFRLHLDQAHLHILKSDILARVEMERRGSTGRSP